MPAPDGDTVRRGLRVWWSSPPRSGARRLIAPWEYRHLRLWARMHIVGGTVAAGLAAVTLTFGGSDWKAYGWAMGFLAITAVQYAFAYWELTIARSTTPAG